MELIFRKPAEIVSLLSTRLRQERLAQQMPQAEVAARAGISANTLSNLEAGRNVGLESLVRVAMVLGRGKDGVLVGLLGREQVDVSNRPESELCLYQAEVSLR